MFFGFYRVARCAALFARPARFLSLSRGAHSRCPPSPPPPSKMEEIVIYKRLELSGDAEAAEVARTHLFRMWRRRIQGCARNIDVWQQLLSVRTLVLPRAQDVDIWLEFASLCRHGGRMMLCLQTLVALGLAPATITAEGEASPFSSIASRLVSGGGGGGLGGGLGAQPGVSFAYMKYKWALGERGGALRGLAALNGVLSASDDARAFTLQPQHQLPADVLASDADLRVRIQLTLGRWNREIGEVRFFIFLFATYSFVCSFYSFVCTCIDDFRTTARSPRFRARSSSTMRTTRRGTCGR